MAAATEKMAGVSDDSSSDDDEVLRRCQEAVWETRTDMKKDGDSNEQKSKRVVVADHEHDGNELQVTKGFQIHVAKKLGHFLDNLITETGNSSRVESEKCNGDADDEGFRLFSSSIPGQTAEEPPAPVRRRRVPSSSDSDSEMEARLKEAAVSIKDLIPSMSLPSTLATPPAEEKLKEEDEESQVVKKKKKKKKKRKVIQEDIDCAGPQLNAKSKGENGNSKEQEDTQVKVKQKKKKKREGNTEALD